MGVFKKSLASTGYVVLNVIRVLNIIALLMVIAASSVMLVKTFVVSKFFFFDAVSHVITAFISIFLIITELPLFRQYFIRNWPLYSHNSGFVALGTTMVILGISTLGNLNKEATSQKSLGLAFWRIVIAAGIVVVVIGVVNIFASYIFRSKKLGLTAREVRSDGAVAPQKVLSREDSTRSYHLSRQGSKGAGYLPSYYSRTNSIKTGTNSIKTETRQLPPRLPLTISSPINNNPEQFAKPSETPEIEPVRTPDLAHHPAMYSKYV